MFGQEDLFNIAQQTVNTIVIRYGDKTKQRYDSSNKLIPFDKLVETISNGVWDCYFTKRNESEIQISVPTPESSGQFDLVVKYNEVNHLFELEVQFNQKTRFRPLAALPNPDFSFQHKCRFAFIDLQSGWPDFNDLSAMDNLFKKAMQLDISPDMTSENQLEIWNEYIEAQSQLIERLYEPFDLIEEPHLTAEPAKNGDGVYRYRLECRLRPQNHNEYDALREKLSEALSIDTDFDSEGVSFMKLDDVYRGLDSVIRREFPDRYEREPKIGCILSIRPFTKAEKIQETKSHLGTFNQRGAYVLVSNLNEPLEKIAEEMSELGYELAGASADYSIKGIDNLYQSEHVEKFSITFSDTVLPMRTC